MRKRKAHSLVPTDHSRRAWARRLGMAASARAPDSAPLPYRVARCSSEQRPFLCDAATLNCEYRCVGRAQPRETNAVFPYQARRPELQGWRTDK